MKTLRDLIAFGILVCLIQDTGAQQPSQSVRREVWLAPQGVKHPSLDFAEMFRPEAPWKDAASHVDVFKLYAGFLLQGTQEQIDAVVGDLNRRGIAIALETGVINVPHNPPSGCGGMGNVEGYRTVEAAEEIARKLKAAHGELKYIAMDEPFYYGHFYTKSPSNGPGCHSSVHEVMALSQPTLSVFVREFPGVVIGETDSTSYLDGEPGWQADLEEWAEEFRTAMDRPLAFMQLDVLWDQPNGVENALAFYKFAQRLQQQGLVGRVGVIYNGTPRDRTDKAWTRAARDHVLLMERNYELRPDQAIFQSWHPNPTRSMPDNAQDTLTSLVSFYFTPAVKALRGEK